MRRRLFVVAVLLAVAGWVALPYARAAAFILDLSGIQTWARRVLPASVHDVARRDVSVPTRYGAVAARLYVPSGGASRSVAVFPGVHAGGADEPRLVAFSTRLAATGLTVLSMPLPELRRYKLSPVSTDMIEDGTAWLAADRSLSPTGRTSMAGVSFAGGLALVAAGRPGLADKVDQVVALGSHADLARVMTYLCTGLLPDGSRRAPHDYGVAIILLAALPRLLPPDQVEPARETITRFLDASSEASNDASKAAALFEAASTAVAALPEPARGLLTLANNRDVAALGPRLTPFIEELGGTPALSPGRSPATRASVFLLHGSEDNVIPSTETPLLAGYLESHGNEHVRWLLTPLLSHASIQKASAADGWKLIRLWKEILAR